MSEVPKNKLIELSTDYANHTINVRFSDNLSDARERGYILSAAFFSYCAAQGLDKQEVIEMVNGNYDQFTGDDGAVLFNRL
jgi:hypothetical protein